jgi:hypothetical protein
VINKSVWCYGCYDVDGEPCGFKGYFDGKEFKAVNNGDYIDGGYGEDYSAIATHWMPLPAAPESI